MSCISKATIVLIFSGLGLVAFQAVFSFRKRYVVSSNGKWQGRAPGCVEIYPMVSGVSTEQCSVTICPILIAFSAILVIVHQKTPNPLFLYVLFVGAMFLAIMMSCRISTCCLGESAGRAIAGGQMKERILCFVSGNGTLVRKSPPRV
jgi:hypothetical protein